VLEWKVRDAAGQTTFVPAAKQGAGWACPGESAVDCDERAISQAAEFLEDPPGHRTLLEANDRPTDVPRPAGSFLYGSPDLRRLRVGRYQVLYEITEEAAAVRHIARGTAGWTFPEIVRATGPDSGQCASQPGTVRELWVKTMLASGSEIVMDFCERAGLVP
jgi:mRNA interferase RelE/StbE